MLVTEEGIVTDSSEVQPEKAPSPILVISIPLKEEGMTTDFMLSLIEALIHTEYVSPTRVTSKYLNVSLNWAVTVKFPVIDEVLLLHPSNS